MSEKNTSNQSSEQNSISRFSSIKATELLQDVVNKTTVDKVKIKDLIDAMDFAGFGLVMMIFSFAVLIPSPPPFPSIMSIPLVIFSAQMMVGFSVPHLPKMFAKTEVKRSTLMALAQKSAPYINKIERLLVPRLFFLFNPIAERIIGAMIFIFAMFILLPIPLSNFLPGLGILIISFGLLAKDGLVIILGIIIGMLGIAVSVAALILGIEIFSHIKNLIF